MFSRRNICIGLACVLFGLGGDIGASIPRTQSLVRGSVLDCVVPDPVLQFDDLLTRTEQESRFDRNEIRYEYNTQTNVLTVVDIPKDGWDIVIGPKTEEGKMPYQVMVPRQDFDFLRKFYSGIQEVGNGSPSSFLWKNSICVDVNGREVVLEGYPIRSWKTRLVDTNADGQLDDYSFIFGENLLNNLFGIYDEVSSGNR
ncbi:MAG: hypothetical protein WC796_03015 [Candidatus Pacearchaeota archaeon]|jgi:hypothetical protein